MEVAMGALGWSPSEFWRATPADIGAAFSGWRQIHGAGDNGVPDMTPAELVGAYDEMMA